MMPISLSLCIAFVTLVGASPFVYCLEEAPTIRILTPASELPFHLHVEVLGLEDEKESG